MSTRSRRRRSSSRYDEDRDRYGVEDRRYNREREREEYFDRRSPPRQTGMDSRMVGMGGVVALVMTNFKDEIRLFLKTLIKMFGSGAL